MLCSLPRHRLAWIAPLALLFLLTGCAPRRIPVAYEVAGRKHTGDLYLPGEGKPEAGIVLASGVVPEGKDNARLVAFATTLARARFAVLAPELSGFRQLRIGPSDAREVADAFVYLASRTDLAPGTRVGIGASSYAVGPAVLAALEPDIREQVRIIVGVGGYHDFVRAVPFFTTGYFEDGGGWEYLKPDDYGFSDQRAFFGIPNFLNMVSNGLFVLAGAAGLRRLLATERAPVFVQRRERWLYSAFFLGVALTGVASAGIMWNPATSAWCGTPGDERGPHVLAGGGHRRTHPCRSGPGAAAGAARRGGRRRDLLGRDRSTGGGRLARVRGGAFLSGAAHPAAHPAVPAPLHPRRRRVGGA
jgi:hypothetical protein